MQSTNINKNFDSLLLSRINGKLYFDGLDLEELLEKIGTPSFVFSEKQLINQYETLKQTFESELSNPFDIAFSIKSNPFHEIVKVLISKKALFEVTSIGEMKRILDLGGKPDKIIYTNIVKPTKTISFAMKVDIQYFAIDSYSDMKRIENVSKNLNRTTKVLIRLNPLIELENTIFSCSGRYSKIGIEIPEKLDQNSLLMSIVSYCEKSPWLDLVGIHMHLGSQITNVELYHRGFNKVCNLMTYLLDCGLNLEVLDIGGGFPVDYGDERVPPITSFCRIIKSELKHSLKHLHIIAESGRFLTASAGLLAVSVATLKMDPQGINTVCIDGSFYNTLPDIITVNWSYPIEKVNQRESDPVLNYRIAGSTNDTLDQYLPRNKPSKRTTSCSKLIEGDLIVFLQAGAYSLSFNSTYCLEDRPTVYFHRKR
jgi:diaminopimelate decarboxylase